MCGNISENSNITKLPVTTASAIWAVSTIRLWPGRERGGLGCQRTVVGDLILHISAIIAGKVKWH